RLRPGQCPPPRLPGHECRRRNDHDLAWPHRIWCLLLMIVYRVTLARHAGDLTGEGARLHGGRWNPPGIPVIYASLSVALASIECFVNTPSEIVSRTDFQRVDIWIPDDAPSEVIKASD